MRRTRQRAALGAILLTGVLALTGCSIGELNEAAKKIDKAADSLESALPTPVGSGPESGSAKLVYARNATGEGAEASSHYWSSAECSTTDGTLFQWTVPNPASAEARSGESFTGIRMGSDTWMVTADLKNGDGKSYLARASAREATESGPILTLTDGGATIDFHALEMQEVTGPHQVYVSGQIRCG